MALYPWLRPLLFRMPAETAHALSLRLLRVVGALPPLRRLLRAALPPVADPVELLGLRFPNRVGLAAGYDKDALALRGLAALGFGHLEIGTVTPRPQPGNPRPRLFRLVEDRSLINRLGFPSQGVERVARRLARRPSGVVLGVNLGKQRETPLEQAAEDYLALMERCAPLADYLTVNVSSPNTPGLRRLEGGDDLRELLAALAARRSQLAADLGHHLPLLVKLSPDLPPDQLERSVEALVEAGIDGVIATNTTLSRDGACSPLAGEAGGLSGALLSARATEALARIARRAADRLVVIGAGGITSGADAAAKRQAGADLVQLYSGLVYRGPALIREAAAAAAAPAARPR